MKIWIYGDSYCTNEDVDYAWFNKLSDFTKCEIQVCGMRGVSNDWIAKQIRDDSEHHSSGDWIIMVATQEDRQWFWNDRPWAGNWQNHTDPQKVLGVSKAEHAAAKGWVKHLYNQEVIAWNSFVQTAWLAAYTMPKDIKFLVIPGFLNSLQPYNPWIHVTGSLTEFVSYCEFASDSEYKKELKGPFGDTRVNHMNPHNHGVLAQKIAKAITHGSLDLTQGFKLARDPHQVVTLL